MENGDQMEESFRAQLVNMDQIEQSFGAQIINGANL